MGALEEGAKVAGGVVNGLKGHPTALALIVINVIFLVAGGLFIYAITEFARENQIRHDTLVSNLARDCTFGPAPKSGGAAP